MEIAATAAATSAATSQAQKSLTGNYETFLRLLTAQLQHQDPLEPLDATKFTEQLVSYSQVEQQIATNMNIETLISATQASAGATAVSFLGKKATTAGPDSELMGGEARWTYKLPASATNIQVRVTDMNGTPVRTLTAPSAAGTHEVVWDGRDNAGNAMPAGTYRLAVAATSSQNTSIPATITGMGMISEIDMQAADPLMFIGSRKVKLSEITGFKN
ncbi:MAG: flagellar hook assembly protein FlgD [Alphaproteobacteria bacterium]